MASNYKIDSKIVTFYRLVTTYPPYLPIFKLRSIRPLTYYSLSLSLSFSSLFFLTLHVSRFLENNRLERSVESIRETTVSPKLIMQRFTATNTIGTRVLFILESQRGCEYSERVAAPRRNICARGNLCLAERCEILFVSPFCG